MKTSILASFVITGFLATSAAQAGTLPSAEELYSGMSASAIQKDQTANPAAERHSTGKSTCKWQEAKSEKKDFDPLYAAYPDESYHADEQAYFAPSNMSLAC